MPRLGLSINETFDSRTRAPKPDPYGRRPRQVSGVQIVGERGERPIFTSLFAKVIVTLSLVAALSTSLALLRLFTFRH